MSKQEPHDDDFDEFLSERIEHDDVTADEDLENLLKQVEQEDKEPQPQQQQQQEEEGEEEIVFDNWNDNDEIIQEEKQLSEKLSSIIIQKKKRKIKRSTQPSESTEQQQQQQQPSESSIASSSSSPPLSEDVILTEQQLSLMMNTILNKFGKIIEIPNQEYISEQESSSSSFSNKNLQRKLIQMDYLIKEMGNNLEKAIVKLALMRKQKQELKIKHKQEKKEWEIQKEKEIEAVKRFYENYIKEKHQQTPPVLSSEMIQAEQSNNNNTSINDTVNSIWNWFGQKK